MPNFPYDTLTCIIVLCLLVCVLGLNALVQMPVDMFPPIDFLVLSATSLQWNAGPTIEADITDTFERFFSSQRNHHMESRSMLESA